MADPQPTLRERTNGFTLTPRQYTRLAWVALISLTAIVLTGAAVRLTGSGLGCPDWPRCYGKAYPPLNLHAFIEFGNRVFTVVVTIAVLAAAIGALRRRPYRRDLARWGWRLPLGVLAQAVLGGFTVRGDLDYGFVMAHFAVSMLLLVAAATLVWLSTHEPGWRMPSSDRLSVWAVRLLLPLGALAIMLGTAATAAGPHAGGRPGQHINRLDFKGGHTLDWMIHQHGAIAALLGVAAVGVWFLLRRRGADKGVRDAVTAVCILLACQGLVGTFQYATHLPAEIVWIHVSLATLTWLAILWSTLEAGRLQPEARTVTKPAAAESSAAAT